ncbi:group II intron reverse transcriptase/maturase [Carboxylicivirga marina]|uniref:Group II intron reverse transcriptase/maturase n=1 Tax=Carboxylicivirga marina TaxID=2800988 RepID=A0ABS1HEU7_9BACT|nr:group II intron reverse transcriptase/maturase [Carboxylicivirga marina]MBK3516168.1 group II intron reverse transcriptase/maturase [Carboxylicivirga marina]
MSIQERVQQEITKLSSNKRRDMSPPERVRLLQLKLYLKAKQERSYKFYVLYDKLFLDHVLLTAYRHCKKKNGAPGVDKRTFEDIEQYGVVKFLQELKEELRTRTYRPQAVKRVLIDKENGGKRPLGIPTIKDRVAQQACKIIMEPIFEADFNNSSYGFRPKRSAAGAVRAIRQNLKKGKCTVYDADLSKYFDKIPHDKLEIVLKERIADSRLLKLIRQWLKVPIVEDGKYTRGKSNTSGTPQGGVISPLLANVYMNILDRIVNNPQGYFQKQGIHMIRYADDFILMSKTIQVSSLNKIHEYLSRMGLLINVEKSKLVNGKEESFDFLGFRFRYKRSVIKPNGRYWDIEPKPKSQQKIRQKISYKLKSIGHYAAPKVVAELNPIIRGWMNYYKIEKVSYTQVAFRNLEEYLRERMTRFYNRKSQRKSSMYGKRAFNILVEEYGLIKPYRTSGLRPVNAFR